MDNLPKDWKHCKLGELVKIRTGKLDSNAMIEDGRYPFFTCSRETFSIDEFAFDCEAILLAGNNASGDFNVKHYNGKFNAYQRTYVITVNEEAKLLYIYLKHQLINNLKVFKEQSVGANTKFLKIGMIQGMNIPLPPLSDQTRIVAKLDALFARIDKSIALLEENIKHTKALMASVLEEVFGNGNSWKRDPLNQVAKVERGKSKHRPRNDARLFGGIYPFVQTGDVRSADKYIEKYEVCYSEFGLKQSKLWKKGTICLTIAANIGDVAILGFDSCFPDSVVGITPKEMNNEFLFYYLKTLQLQLDRKANSAAQKNINLKILSEIDVPVPPIKMQNIIAKWFTSLEEKQFKIIGTQQSKLVYLKALKSSLLDRAFKGEL